MRPRVHTIRESVEELNELRHFYEGTVEELKLGFLRYLKEHPNNPLADAAEYVGITTRRGRYWWGSYRKEGLRGLLSRRAWGREDLERKALPVRAELSSQQANSRLSSQSVVDYPAFLNAIAEIAGIHDLIEWSRALGNIIIDHFLEVDYSVVSIRSNIDLSGRTSKDQRMVLRQGKQSSGEMVEDFQSLETNRPNYEVIIEQGQRHGFTFNRFHFPPLGFDFFLKKGRRTERKIGSSDGPSICVGSLLLFRYKELDAFSAETTDIVERLRPFFTFIYTDFIARLQQDAPGIESSNQLIDRIRGEIHITSREQDVLCLLLTGYSEKRIAEALHISPKTVESHIHSIYRKTGVTKMNELFARYQYQLPISNPSKNSAQ